MSHKKVERIDPLTQALPCVGCDSHAHLDGEEFDADREEVLARARAAGVATIGNIFLDPDRWRRRRGTHPLRCTSRTDTRNPGANPASPH